MWRKKARGSISTERRSPSVENSPQRKCETNQKKSVQAKHRGAGAPLHRIRIVRLEDKILRENAFVGFIEELAERFRLETRRANKATNPELRQPRVFWIDLKCALLDATFEGPLPSLTRSLQRSQDSFLQM
jgi:hypothetical protein